MEKTIDGTDLNGVIIVLDALVKTLKDVDTKTRERSLLITKLEEAKMWAQVAWETDPE